MGIRTNGTTRKQISQIKAMIPAKQSGIFQSSGQEDE